MRSHNFNTHIMLTNFVAEVLKQNEMEKQQKQKKKIHILSSIFAKHYLT